MMFKRILGTVLAAAVAASIVASPAAAHDPNNTPRIGIWPAAFAPFGIAAAVGTSTKTFSWITTQSVFSHKNYFVLGHNVPKWKYDLAKLFNSKLPPKLHKLKVPIHKEKVFTDVETKHTSSGKSRSKMGKAVVGCIMGSAFGAITASMRKATALGNPPRWRSQAEHERIVASGYEKQFELTSDEASIALAACGLGSLTLHWPRSVPAVPARY